MAKLIRNKKKKICITIDDELNDLINNAIINKKYQGSKSKFFEDAVKVYLGTNKDKLPKQVEDVINHALKNNTERIARLLAKNSKSSYASLFLVLKMFAYMCNSEEDEMFLLTSKKEAEKRAYQAVRQDLDIETDIEKLFPTNEIIDEIEKKKGQQ